MRKTPSSSHVKSEPPGPVPKPVTVKQQQRLPNSDNDDDDIVEQKVDTNFFVTMKGAKVVFYIKFH